MSPLSGIYSRDFYRIRKLVLLCTAIVTGGASGAVLYGWMSNSVVLKSVFPSLTPMNPMTAVCFIALAICLAGFAIFPSSESIRKIIASITVIILLAVAGSILARYVFDVPSHVDRLLFTAKLGINHMAPNTAICFALIGLAILAHVYIRRTVIVVRILAILIALVALYALAGYAYGVQPVYGVAILNPMALHVSVLFLLVAVTLFSVTIDKFVIYISVPLLGTYVLAILVFIFLSSISFRNFNHLKASNSQVQNIYTQQASVDDLRTALLDAETGQRGYLLTSTPEYLAPYSAAVLRVQSSLGNLAALPSNVLNHQDSVRLGALTNDKMSELASTINYKRAGNTNAALTLVATNRGKADLDAIRVILTRADSRIGSSLATKLRQSKTQNQNSLLLLSSLTATTLCLLLASLYLLQENLKRQLLRTMTIESRQKATIVEKHNLEGEVSSRVAELEKVKRSLEDEVQKRTDELKVELDKSQQQNSFMVNRELKMVELKKELESLRAAIKK